jgi:4-hydroxy-3-polyprenylbenzoate decarboxylase
MPGIIAIEIGKYVDEQTTTNSISLLTSHISHLTSFPLIVICDDSQFASQTLNNFLWVTFTRSNPSHDVHGINSFTENKHWGCNGSLIIDARIKPHHAPPLIKDPAVEKRVDALGAKGKSLFGII